MNVALIAFLVSIAAPRPAAQDAQELPPVAVATTVQDPTVQQLAEETGLTPQHVRMVLGSRSDHADYRIVFDRVERQFRQSLGEERYRDLLAGRPIELRNVPPQELVAATRPSAKAGWSHP
ncbi:MAG: hypothetical protein J7507_13230 [Pseudoxanthomonas sp.]|nr:hypothetical protein [Pseudoxanthomonas sp.]